MENNEINNALLNMFLKMEKKDFAFIFMMKKGKRQNFLDSKPKLKQKKKEEHY